MANAAAVIGVALTSQVASNASSNAGSGLWGGVNQIGQYILPTGLINYDLGVHLYRTDLVDQGRFQSFRRFSGMEGETKSRDHYFLSTIGPNGVAVLNQTGTGEPYHINDIAMMVRNNVPSIDETLFLFNRGLINIDLTELYLKQNTSGETGLANAWFQSRHDIPGPSDLIHFAVRDAFSPDVVATFQYNRETPVAIIPWMEKQGYGGSLGFNIPPGSTTTDGPDAIRPARWFDLYWWSHWQLPSPTQGYEFLHRMYLTSSYGAAPGITAANQFTNLNMELLLKANDYPEFWRDKFIHVSYHPLTRVDVRRMFDMHVLEESDVYHAYRAIGYDDDNALKLLNWTIKLRADKELKANRTPMLKEIRELFLLGAFTEIQARNQMGNLLMTEAEVFPIIKQWKMVANKLRLKEGLATIREGFNNGTFTFLQVNQSLSGLGFDPAMVTQYAQAWNARRTAKRRFVSAQDNINFYEKSLISQNQLVQRLTNLNFDSAEITLMVQYSNKKVGFLIGQDIAKQQTAQMKANKAALEMLLKPYTDANIKLFNKKGLLGPLDVYKIMRLRGYTNKSSLQWVNAHLGTTLDDEQIKEAKELDIEQTEADVLDEEQEVIEGI